MTKVHVPSPGLAHDDAYHPSSGRPCTGAHSLSETVPHGVVTWMKGQPRPSWQLSPPMQFQTLEGFGTMRLVPNWSEPTLGPGRMSQSSIPTLPRPKSSLVSGTFLCLSAGQSRAHRGSISALGKPLHISGPQAPNPFYRDSNTYLLRFAPRFEMVDGAHPGHTGLPGPHAHRCPPHPGCFEDV